MIQRRFVSFISRGLTVALFAGLVAWQSPAASAAPYTDNFDALIAELQSRSGALSNSVEKADQTKFKACQKVLKTLLGKDSTSLATDIKNAGKISKTLFKAFPDEFLTGTLAAVVNANIVVTLGDLLDELGTSLTEDVASLGTDIQTALDALPASTCKTAAQAALDDANAALAAVNNAPDFPTGAKLLGTALKAFAKAQAAQLAAVNCNSGGGGGGGGSGGMSAQVNGQNFSAPLAIGTYTTANQELTITGALISGEKAITLIVFNVTGTGPYAAGDGTMYQEPLAGIAYAGNMTGTVTFTTFSLAQGKAQGSFSFSATQNAPSASTNSVTVTSGNFQVDSILQLPF